MFVCLASLVLPAVANAKPKFTKRYRGTLSGHHTQAFSNGDLDVQDSMVFVSYKLHRVLHFSKTWIAYYKINGGVAFYSDKLTGSCTYDVKDDYGLLSFQPKHGAAPLALTRDLLGRWSYGGVTTTTKTYDIDRVCTNSDGTTGTLPTHLDAAVFFDPVPAPSGKPGQRLHGKSVFNDTHEEPKEHLELTWDLRPY